MITVYTLLVTLFFTLLVQRIGATALTMTGLSEESAKFQSRSAFCGVGFTTKEAEMITGHPVRRRIVYTLMLVGNIGLATVTATLIASLIQANSEPDIKVQIFRFATLTLGLGTLWIIATNRWVEKQHNRIVSWALKTFTKLDVSDVVSIMNLQAGFSVVEISVDPDEWMNNKSLRDLKLTKEGILVLGIRRNDGTFLGAPRADARIVSGDILVMYGPTERIEELDHRKADRSGEEAHLAAIHQHDIEKQHQTEVDPVEQS